MYIALIRVISFLILGFLLGIFVSYFFGNIAGIFAALIIMAFPLGFAYVNLSRFEEYLTGAGDSDISDFSGAWGQAFYRLQKLIKNLRQQNREIEAQHQRFIEAFQASPNGIVMLDKNEQIEWCNSIAEEFLGLNFKRDALQRIHFIVRRPEFVDYIKASHYEEPILIEQMGPTNNLILMIQAFPFATNRRLLLIQDVTDLRKAEAMRRDFVANVSHEMRTPLTVMMGFLETVQSLNLNPEQKDQYLGLMMDQARRMKNLVDDLLTLANIEANTQPAPQKIVSMAALMAMIQNDAQALSKNQHQLSFDISVEDSLKGEERELISALSNLVSNAIRYTPQGGNVNVSWRVEQSGKGVFSVTDTGSGIAPEHLPRLTERFYRVDRSRSRETGGTGLGLAIVKHIANRHQAELKIESTLGKGSTFTLIFPAERIALATPVVQ
jgi:two-component system phosphate regulon sensor histidine kinase PhoR